MLFRNACSCSPALLWKICAISQALYRTQAPPQERLWCYDECSVGVLPRR